MLSMVLPGGVTANRGIRGDVYISSHYENRKLSKIEQVYLEALNKNYYINSNKTKEMVLGSLSKEPVVPLTVLSTIVEQVPVYLSLIHI